MGRVLAKEGLYAEADQWYAEAVARNPQAQWWWVERANVLRESGDLGLAIDLYRHVTEQFPDWAPGYFELAWAYRLAEHAQDAAAAIERAIRLMSPADAAYHARGGQIYEWWGDIERAEAAYREALLVDRNNGTALEGLQRVEGQHGQDG